MPPPSRRVGPHPNHPWCRVNSSGKFSGRTQNSFPQRVFENPEVVSRFLLVIPPGGAELFEAAYLSFDVGGLGVKVHPFLGDLGVGSASL